MGIVNKVKKAAASAMEQSRLEEQQAKDNLLALTAYVHNHIKEFNDFFVETKGKLYPVKSALIFGESKTSEDIELLLEGLDVDDEGVLFMDYLTTDTPYYIDTKIGRLYVSAGAGLLYH